jgi:hypothetical protein
MREELIPVELPSSWDYVVYRNIADIHRACNPFRKRTWHDLIKEIKDDPRQRIIGNGDWFHAALKQSKSDSYEATMTLDDELDAVAEEIEPVVDRIDALDDGNHEERTHKLDSLKPMKILADKLGIKDKYQGTSSVVKVTFGKKPNGKRNCAVIYAQHGFGGGKRKGAVANMLEDLGNLYPLADVFFGGHMHLGMSFKDCLPYPDLQNNKNLMKVRTFVATSSLSGYEPWLERIGRRPNAVVIPSVLIKEDKTVTVTL